MTCTDLDCQLVLYCSKRLHLALFVLVSLNMEPTRQKPVESNPLGVLAIAIKPSSNQLIYYIGSKRHV